MTFWDPGTQIRWCYGEAGSDFVNPMTVVRDDEAALVASGWAVPGPP